MKVGIILFVAILLLAQLIKYITTDNETHVDQEIAVSITLDDTEIQRQASVETARSEQRRKKLDELNEKNELRKLAIKDRDFMQQTILRSYRSEWHKLLDEHKPVYHALVAKATLTHNKMIECTICEGDTYLEFCVFCESEGTCRECKGAGHYFGKERCPPCMGSGNCFICGGRTHMICPFCDDGTVDLALEPPFKAVKL